MKTHPRAKAEGPLWVRVRKPSSGRRKVGCRRYLAGRVRSREGPKQGMAMPLFGFAALTGHIVEARVMPAPPARAGGLVRA